MNDFKQDSIPDGSLLLERTLMYHIHWTQPDSVVGVFLVADALEEYAECLRNMTSGSDEIGEWTASNGIRLSWLHGSRVVAAEPGPLRVEDEAIQRRREHIEEEAQAKSIAVGQPDPFFAEIAKEQPLLSDDYDKMVDVLDKDEPAERMTLRDGTIIESTDGITWKIVGTALRSEGIKGDEPIDEHIDRAESDMRQALCAGQLIKIMPDGTAVDETGKNLGEFHNLKFQ